MADHAALVILIMGLVTLATRLLPVLIFDRWERVPDYIISCTLGRSSHSQPWAS